jgi:peptidylamidoglycolate lyase
MIIPKILNRLCVLLIIVGTGCNNNNNPDTKNKISASSAYEMVKGWPQLSEGYVLSQPTGIGIDTSGNIFVFHRTGRTWTEPFPDSLISMNTVLMLDKETGKILNSWGANYFIMPHGLTVDKDNNVWLTDVGLHQIFKFSHEGKLLMKLGVAKTPGNDSLHFNLPTDIAVKPDGSFYVSDGYGNSRVVKFSADGHYLFEWGKKGTKQSEFQTPHGIDLDAKGNVYVADRENNRIQVFDSTGKYLKEWDDSSFKRVFSVNIQKNTQKLFSIDYMTISSLIVKGSDVLLFNDSLNLINRFGRTGNLNQSSDWYHDLAVDKDGNIYVGDITNKKLVKFKPLK